MIHSPEPEFEVTPDKGAAVPLKLIPSTIVQRVAPGEKYLKNATAINISEVVKGDRVLVTLTPNSSDVLRLVVMAVTDIAKRDQADQQDWLKRGISGIVAAKNNNQIIFKVRTPQGEVQQVVAVSDKTAFKRYAADSVNFADAKSSKLDEVSVGDQLRARGVKSADGMKVDAEEVVFGTFVTKAGTVVSDVPGKQLTVKELGSAKSFAIKIAADSRIEQVPSRQCELLQQAVPTKYNVTLSVTALNPLNHPSFGNPNGNLSSPLFGQSLNMQNFFFPGNATYNRKITMQIQVGF